MSSFQAPIHFSVFLLAHFPSSSLLSVCPPPQTILWVRTQESLQSHCPIFGKFIDPLPSRISSHCRVQPAATLCWDLSRPCACHKVPPGGSHSLKFSCFTLPGLSASFTVQSPVLQHSLGERAQSTATSLPRRRVTVFAPPSRHLVIRPQRAAP